MRRMVILLASIALVTVLVLSSFIWFYSKVVVKDYYSTFPGEMGPTVLEPGRLTLEVDYQSGYEPNDDALYRFSLLVRQYSGRETSIVKERIYLAQAENYTIDDVIELERSHRNITPSSDTHLGLYILYLGGKFRPNPDILGITYLSLSIVIFKSEVKKYAPQQGPCDSIMIVNECKVERSILMHEFGHVLGLVNLIYTSPRDHEDPHHPGHCLNESCVMYYSIDAYRGGLPRSPPYTLDDDCLADLDLIRSSSYGKYYLKDPRFVIVVAMIIAGSCLLAGVVFFHERKRPRKPIQTSSLQGTRP